MLRFFVFIGVILSFSVGFQMSSNKRIKMPSSLFASTGDVSPRLSESPTIDRALDNALDFLQSGDSENSQEDEEEDEMALYEIFEDSPDIEIPYDLIQELELKEAKAASSKLPSAASINKSNILNAVQKFKQHSNDVGSAAVQIASANERIKYLTKHLLANKKDKAAMRGLDALVNHRRKLLNYVYKHDQAKAESIVAELGIRFRAPGQLWDKETKYRAFKNTKSKWLKIRAEKKAMRAPSSASA